MDISTDPIDCTRAPVRMAPSKAGGIRVRGIVATVSRSIFAADAPKENGPVSSRAVFKKMIERECDNRTNIQLVEPQDVSSALGLDELAARLTQHPQFLAISSRFEPQDIPEWQPIDSRS